MSGPMARPASISRLVFKSPYAAMVPAVRIVVVPPARYRREKL